MLQFWTDFTIPVASTQQLQSPMSALLHPFNYTLLNLILNPATKDQKTYFNFCFEVFHHFFTFCQLF